MADRYWVGGTGTWNTTSTTNWSASSGGSSGASVPTAADSVFFDQAGTYTVTMTGALTCLDFTVSAGTVTFATGTSPTLAVSGSMSLIAGTVWNATGTITFNATTTGKTITTNGTSLGGAVTLNGVGGAWTLGSALNIGSNTLTVTNGSFNTGNYALTASTLSSSNSNTRTITLGSSTVTLSSTIPVSFATSTSLTFDAGTSQINLSATSAAGFAGAGLTYYNVAFTGNAGTTSQIRSITGANTFNNLTLIPRNVSDIVFYAFGANQIINGTLTISPSTDATMRVALVPATNYGYAATLGVTRTLTCNAVASLTDVDFADIAFAGNCISGGNITGTRLGDMKGNSGISLTAGTTKYWNLAAGGNWSATAWATTGGGTPAVNNFPLAQDTCVFQSTGLNSGATVTVNAAYGLATIDMSARTSNTMTFNSGAASPFIFGNFINGTGVTLSGTNGLTFGGRGSQTITSAGKSFGFPISINSSGGTVTLQDAFTCTSGTCFHTSGTIALNNFTWTCSSFTQTGVGVALNLAFGTGNITVTGSGTVFTGTGTATCTGTPNVYLTYSGAIATSISPSSVSEANSINFIITAGTYSFSISSSERVKNLDFSNGGTSTYTGDWAGGTNTLTCYGNLTLKSGMTVSGTGAITLGATSGTKTITSAGLTNTHPLSINAGATYQLLDALTLSTTVALGVSNGSTLNVNSQTVTAGLFNFSSNAIITGNTSAFIASGTGTVWTATSTTSFANTPSVTLSDNSATARTFNGGGATYGTLTIGGTTGTSNTTIQGSNTFSTFTSTKTVAHTITFTLNTTQTISTWSVNGSAGNLVTLASSSTSAYSLYFSGPTSASYLSVSYCTSTVGEFYVGATSTNGGNNNNVYFTTAPAATTYYWVGGTGNWDSATTTNWATSSGGAGGAGFPTSVDDVVFDVNSNVGTGAFSVTMTGTPRCKSLTFGTGAQALDGTMTLSGSVNWLVFGSFTLPATNLTRTFTGGLIFASTTTGNTVTTNGVSLGNAGPTFGQGALGTGGYWTLGSDLTTLNGTISVVAGTFDTSTSNYAITSSATFTSTGTVSRTIKLNASSLALASSTPVSFTTTGLTFNAGTSTITCSAANPTFSGAGLTFYNVVFSFTGTRAVTMSGANTFNNLDLSATSSGAYAPLSKYLLLAANIVVNGTFFCNNSGAPITNRIGVQSSVLGTQRTITAAAVSLYNTDFRDIAGAGAATWTGTSLGDAKGNSGITFPAAKTVYWNLAGAQSWSATGWATSSGGTPATANFPLPQDTAIFDDTGSVTGTITVNLDWYIGTLNMSARTSAMTLATSSSAPFVIGNWINGSGVTITGSGNITFAGRGSQTLTSASKTFPQPFIINTLGGLLTLQDALTLSSSSTGVLGLTNGTLDLNGYTLTFSSTTATTTFYTSVGTKNITFNGGSIFIATSSTTAFNNSQPTGFTTTAGTGIGTISFTSASAKTIVGGSSTYNCVLNQGGAGALTITGSNTFSNITNTYSATGATSILLSSGQTVAAFTASGAATKLLTLSSSTAGTQATIALTGGGTVSTDYLNVQDIAFTPAPATDGTTPYVWYLGANSTNSGNNTGGLFQAGGTGALKVYQIANTATTSWTVPSDWNSSSNTIHLIGGGGGGAGAAATGNTKAAGAGGGGGGYRVLNNYSATSGSSITVVVGTGGSGGNNNFGSATNGGNTSWATINTATGGAGGSTTSTPTSIGGTGGSGTYSGGTGGAGAVGTTASTGYGGGGGGGAAGVNGVGGTGGAGFGSTTATSIAGGGGGGNGGGTNGTAGSAGLGGSGGNNSSGTGGATGGPNIGAAGTLGGGGAGGASGNLGGLGGVGIDILNTIGSGGGRGGASSTGTANANTLIYGGGGAGAGVSIAGATGTGGTGAQGLIVIAYTPSTTPTATGNFLMMFE